MEGVVQDNDQVAITWSTQSAIKEMNKVHGLGPRCRFDMWDPESGTWKEKANAAITINLGEGRLFRKRGLEDLHRCEKYKILSSDPSNTNISSRSSSPVGEDELSDRSSSPALPPASSSPQRASSSPQGNKRRMRERSLSSQRDSGHIFGATRASGSRHVPRRRIGRQGVTDSSDIIDLTGEDDDTHSGY